MIVYTTSTFREALSNLVKKKKDGYSTVIADICKSLSSMPLRILRDSNDRILQTPDFRIVKLRLPNTGQQLSKANGFRLIYMVSLISEKMVLLRIYPKRGPQGIVNLIAKEYQRLIIEMTQESIESKLHEVDINRSLNTKSINFSLI